MAREISREEAQRRNGIVTYDADVTVVPGQKLIRVRATADRTVTLPPPSEWAGDTIVVRDMITGFNVTVSASGHETVPFSDVVLNLTNEHVGIYSDGENVYETITGYA